MPVDKSVVDAQLESLGDFHRFFTSKEIRYLPQILSPAERIFGITSGFYQSKTWLIVITNRRLLFLDKGMFFGLKQVEMPLNQITSISHKTGLFFGELEVSASTGIQAITNIGKKDVIKICSIISGLIHGSEESVEEAPIQKEITLDLAAQLERISNLHDRKALTDEEFSAFKKKLLNDSGYSNKKLDTPQAP